MVYEFDQTIIFHMSGVCETTSAVPKVSSRLLYNSSASEGVETVEAGHVHIKAVPGFFNI